ncbi:agmatine deiminase family protein [Pseudanabaena yagii]|uniref:Agmatine deiminase family protein n=1 Tax=Pseudanabaena yagii GIHE-NHR1 TaxID=2722753 RepID=A0ABX1LQI2_9CYAN|nr:agmatine deiminase family protein [Pseudanabaena yagii]NMF57598.1 agmatine deiminase family protein [Pseudanabaena yagii GIHE-NHR1]
MENPKTLGYAQPAEWQPHSACWLAFPSHRDLWLEYLDIVQAEFVALAKAISTSEQLEILVLEETAALAKQLLGDLPVCFHQIPFGDIWMRDMTPIYIKNADGKLGALHFQWNGWGGKYMLEHDDRVAANILQTLDFPTFEFDWVLEGGAIEVDGEGTCLTTKQCLLNPNRNPHLDQEAIESGLKIALGVEKVLWIEEGLLNDHTDGHIDTIARFIAPHTIMCMEPTSEDDPNYQVLKDIASQLETMTDAKGRKIDVVRIPSPNLVLDDEDEIMPASYLNFYISNDSVIIPIYGSPNDELAVQAIAKHFPNRKAIGLSAKHILLGGGAFHCITCHQPQ